MEESQSITKEGSKSPVAMEARASPVSKETSSSPVSTETVSRESSISPSHHQNKHRRKAPPPPGGCVEPLDLAGIQLREKVGEIEGGANNRPKSEFIVNRPAPPPPTRTVSLKTGTTPPPTGTTPPPAPIKEEQVKKEEKGVVDETRENREKSAECDDDNSSQSSEGATLPLGAISPKTKQRLTSYLNRVGQGGNQLETLAETEGLARRLNLPTEFSNDLALELIDVIRNR